jgi:hypothetical protein
MRSTLKYVADSLLSYKNADMIHIFIPFTENYPKLLVYHTLGDFSCPSILFSADLIDELLNFLPRFAFVSFESNPSKRLKRRHQKND